MSDLERQLRSFPTHPAPERVWERLQGRTRPSWRARFKGGIMLSAAAGLLALLFTALTWSPVEPAPSQAGSRQSDAWVDREPAEGDLPGQDRIVINALVADLGEGTPSRREAAQKLLEARLETALPLLRKAARGDNADLRAAAESLIQQWDDRRDRIPLGKLLAGARKEAKPKEEWKGIAERAVTGDSAALAEIRTLGWQAAPSIADAAANAGGAEQLRARSLLRDLLLPRLHEGRPVVTLVARKMNANSYEESAYSFRYATQDAAAIQNVIDVVYNPCGLLHFTPYGGTETFLADAGKTSLGQVTELPKEGWRRANCIRPEPGHVYVIEIRAAGAGYTYKFEVKKTTGRSIDIEWAGIGEPRKAPPINQGKNGMFGTCPAPHPEY